MRLIWRRFGPGSGRGGSDCVVILCPAIFEAVRDQNAVRSLPTVHEFMTVRLMIRRLLESFGARVYTTYRVYRRRIDP